MPQETAKVKDFPEQSPVAQARAHLGMALERLEAVVQARVEEALRRAAPQEDSEQWRNACRMLEEQLASLKDENSRLHSELHQMRAETAGLRDHAASLEQANRTAATALDEAIASVESLLKGA